MPKLKSQRAEKTPQLIVTRIVALTHKLSLNVKGFTGRLQVIFDLLVLPDIFSSYYCEQFDTLLLISVYRRKKVGHAGTRNQITMFLVTQASH